MQQIPFIELFKLALHVSGDKFFHPQEHFLTVHTSFGTMHRYCCRPVAISVHCTKAVYTVKKCSWGWTSLSPETCRANLKSSIKGICCVIFVIYIVVLMMRSVKKTSITLHCWNLWNHDRHSLTFWLRNYFFNFSTPVYKIWITQEPNTLELWNKLHFEEEKTESIYHV